jgi:hypothetical protein
MALICSRDFNEILFGCEKGRRNPMQEASEVSLGLGDCDLHEWGFIGTALSGLSSNMSSCHTPKFSILGCAWKTLNKINDFNIYIIF